MSNKFLWALLLTLSCSPVLAEWIKIASNERSVFYMETPVSKKVLNHVMVLIVRDHKNLQHDRSEPYLSSKDEIEVDCGKRRIRRMYSSDHLEHMGDGPRVFSEHGPMSWNDASPNTIVKRIVDIACIPA